MTQSVQARLDRESRRKLDNLVRRLGWSPSKVVREGIRLLDACHGKGAARRIVGLGKFSSGKADLGSTKAHLKGFGR
jgi:hypothetical protein